MGEEGKKDIGENPQMKVIDLPRGRYRDKSIYGRVVKLCIDRWSSIDGIRAIYQIGGVSAPGVSDLDVMLVLDNFPARIELPGGEDVEFAFMHSPFFCDVELWRSRFFFLVPGGERLLWGEDIGLEKLGKEEMDLLRRLLAYEYLIDTLLSIFYQLKRRRVGWRPILCTLHSLRADFELLGREYPLEAEVKRWRNSMELPTPKQAEEILQKAVDGMLGLLRERRGLVDAVSYGKGFRPVGIVGYVIRSRDVFLKWRLGKGLLGLPEEVYDFVFGKWKGNEELWERRQRAIAKWLLLAGEVEGASPMLTRLLWRGKLSFKRRLFERFVEGLIKCGF